MREVEGPSRKRRRPNTRRSLLQRGPPTGSALRRVSSAGAQAPVGDDIRLSRLVGRCVLEGEIAGKATTHDVNAEWVLNHLYVRLHEVSRENDAAGRPAYEAIVYVTWYPPASE